jgi:hypothetical protein
MTNQQHVRATVIVVASVLIAGVVITAQSKDRFTLKSLSGIAFAEFKGYEDWQLIATSEAGNDGCGTSKVGCTKAILGNPVMVKAYRDGIPANGKAVPDGAKIAKIEWLKAENPDSPYQVTVPGVETEVALMIKDSKRFPETNGWGYATFQYDATAGTYKPSANHKTASFAKDSCHACHTSGAKARDFVYTDYAKR